MTLTPEKLAKLRETAKAANQTQWRRHDYNYVIPEDYEGTFETCWIATCFTGDDAAHIAAADPQTVLALVEEVERLRAKNAAYHDRLHHPCEGCPGCSSNDCPDALDIAQIDLAEVRDEILRLRDSNAKVTDARDNLLDEVGRLQARVAGLEAAMAQRMGVYAAPKDERQVGS